MPAEGWPTSTEGWVKKLQQYSPQILELIDSGEDTITINVEEFYCGHGRSLPSVLDAAVNLAATCGVTVIFTPTKS